MKDYPLFIPPAGIREKAPDAWSKDEAKQYFKWLISVIDNRTSFLAEYFGEDLSTAPEVLLKRLGEKVVEALRSKPFVEYKPIAELTNAGFALAADMGLLIARLLLSNPEVKAKWFLVTARRHIDYNLPVIKGDSHLTFNPIRVSTCGVVRGLKNGIEADPQYWLKSYLDWKSTFSSKAAGR